MTNRILSLALLIIFLFANNVDAFNGINLSVTCGDSSNGYFEQKPDTALCKNGVSLGVFDGTKLWYWICKDNNSDFAVLCSANKAVEAECGYSHQKILELKPVSGLCNKGTPSLVYGNSPWIWLCNSLSGDDLKVCFSLKEGMVIDGVCGAANGKVLPSKPTTDLCLSGTDRGVFGIDVWTWVCLGSNGGSNANCRAEKSQTCNWTCGNWSNCSNGSQTRTCTSSPAGCTSTNPYPTTQSCTSKIDGVCGAANGKVLPSKPTTDLCLSGTDRGVFGIDVWTWVCLGSNGGSNANCSARKETGIKIMAYIQTSVPGVTESSYRLFIDDINELFKKNGINVNFLVGSIKWYNPGESCGRDFGGNDVIMCVGPGKGGYLGPPYYISGANTNSPYGFTDIGVMSEAHELAHYLGFQDLYWLKTVPTVSPLPYEIEHDIMTYNYDMNNFFGVNAKYVIQMNADRLKSGGKEMIIYPKYRLPTKYIVDIGVPNKTCSVYSRERDYTIFKSRISNTHITKITNSQGFFELEIFGGELSDNNFDVYYIMCGNDYYWMSSLTGEDCYRSMGANSVCRVVCSPSGWCSMKK